MAIQRETWVDYIINNLFKNSDFVMKAFAENASVLGGKVVHIPQAGAKPTVEKGRTTLPAVAVKRTDTDITYPLEWYTTDPTHIQNAEEAELSYDKMSSILGEHLQALRERMGDEMAIKWLSGAMAANNVVLTSGDDAAVTEAGQTGTRKVTKESDVKKLNLLMNKQNIAKEGRVLVLESNMLDQLTTDLGITQNRDFSQYFDARTGVIGKLHGFEIMERSDLGMANAAGDAINAYGAAVQSDDNVCGLAFQKNCVARALGNVDFFENKQDATYYGDVYSADIRFGGRVRRANAEGVFVIQQSA